MPQFECKYALGEMVDFEFGPISKITGTIQAVTFRNDAEPKYTLEEFEAKKWTETYYDIFESNILTAPKKGSDNGK